MFRLATRTHYKWQVLKVLEEDGILICDSDRKRRGTHPKGTKLRFLAADQRHAS